MMQSSPLLNLDSFEHRYTTELVLAYSRIILFQSLFRQPLASRLVCVEVFSPETHPWPASLGVSGYFKL